LVLKATDLNPASQPPPPPLHTLDALLLGAMRNPHLSIEDRVEAAAQLLLYREPVAGHA
jgi:hypothetical protein